MSADSNASAPKPLSASAIFKLLKAQGQGSKMTIQPEHIAAFDAAIEALSFQYQVRQLAAHGSKALERAAAPSRPEHHREPREAREPREQRPSRPAPKPAPPPRPTQGSGAIWTPEEEARMLGQWERGDAIGAIAEAHKRSAAACFSRLIRIGKVEQSPESSAAMHLIKSLQLVSIGNRDEWLAHAVGMGFDPAAAAAPAPRKAPAP